MLYKNSPIDFMLKRYSCFYIHCSCFLIHFFKKSDRGDFCYPSGNPYGNLKENPSGNPCGNPYENPYPLCLEAIPPSDS